MEAISDVVCDLEAPGLIGTVGSRVRTNLGGRHDSLVQFNSESSNSYYVQII